MRQSALSSNEYLERLLTEARDHIVMPDEDKWEKPIPRWDGLARVDRMDWTRKYAWSIPNEEALECLARHAPIVDMGAGTGYWSYLMRQRGIDVIPYNVKHSVITDHFSKYVWVPQSRGGPAKLRKHGDRTLFLSWPDYNTDFAARCLEEYPGDTVIYVGEGSGGCTGDAKFHERLDGYRYDENYEEQVVPTPWRETETVAIPQWWGMNDYMAVYKREGRRP